MKKAKVNIQGVLINCDQSLENIELSNGYKIKKVSLNDTVVESEIFEKNRDIKYYYLNSVINNEYVMCLYKETEFNIETFELKPNMAISDVDIDNHYIPQIEKYNHDEEELVNDLFNVMHLYKEGNIGLKRYFINIEFNYFMGNYKNNTTVENESKNIIDCRKYTLLETDKNDFRDFVNLISSKEYAMLKPIISEFVWGLEQIDIPTGFEQYITSLEMLILDENQRCKKECLAKRISALVGKDDSEIIEIYEKLKKYYKYRSESLHDGDGINITSIDLYNLEKIVRTALTEILSICKRELNANEFTTWEIVKKQEIDRLKNIISNYQNSGFYPQEN